jgi:hypothetical protein
MKKRLKAFLGSKIERTIYEKENKLYRSLRVSKAVEIPIDCFFLVLLIVNITFQFTENIIILYILLIIMLLLLPRRSINRNNI